ncbi:hypothetical protein AXFE_28410 [Acidithrix ferrooxidans]|uniref:Uncharacterized protein n=1 Tax=Acidithrix ferrooxidans TaxID=1280514 RepID=A0A0D8HEK4_9ACTN|nr:hypothetical protein AXFE_28410 [Acidithrix ferrooxidans]
MLILLDRVDMHYPIDVRTVRHFNGHNLVGTFVFAAVSLLVLTAFIQIVT